MPEAVLRQLYQMVQISVIVYVLDPSRSSQIEFSIKHLEFLMAEIEL